VLSVTASARSDCGFAAFARPAITRCFISQAALSVTSGQGFHSRELRMGFEQEPDPFRDDARLPVPAPATTTSGPFAMLYRRALLRVELNSWNWSAGVVRTGRPCDKDPVRNSNTGFP